MHVSRAEDKGGNTIQVQFDGRGTNLHSVWDSKLIDHSGLTYVQMAKQYDTATPEQIKQWQSDEIMKWLYESYEISSRLYKEVESNNKLDDAYYDAHMPIVKQRIEMAGIRLATVLNRCLKDGLYPPIISGPDVVGRKNTIKPLAVEQVAQHIGDSIEVCSKVTGVKILENMALVNMGGEYPNQLLTVVLKGDNIKFAHEMDNKKVCVSGKVIMYKGKPEIVVTDPQQLEY
jgi:hypothetical protein